MVYLVGQETGNGVSGWTVMIVTPLGCRREFRVKERKERVLGG